jgi:purine-binding chemotaxis protein CheW
MTEARAALDWQEAYSRLERLRQRLAASGAVSPDEVSRILRQRAQTLARPLADTPTTTDVLELAIFALAGTRYGIEATHVLEVLPLRELTPVPCTPPCILGVMNHRGRILPILDLRRLLALAVHEVAAQSRVVAVEAGGMTFGILADAVPGTIRVEAHAVMPPPVTLPNDHQTFVQGVTAEMVAILNLEVLARDPRLTVDEEVG